MKYVALRKSKREQPPGARLLKEASGNENIRITLVVRPNSSKEARLKAVDELGSRLPHHRKHLSVQDFVKIHGARDQDLALVKDFAEENGFRVVELSKARRCVVLAGTTQKFSGAFKVRLNKYTHRGQTYRSHSEAIQIPGHLEGIVEAVLGFDDRPLMTHHTFLSRNAAAQHIDPSEVIRTYDFPTNVNGKGECIAIIELGGGFHVKDIKEYFRTHRLQIPKVKVIEIDAAKNNPAGPKAIEKVLSLMGLSSSPKNSHSDQSELIRAAWTIESTLDIQLTGAFANGARLAVYFAPNNAHGKYHALTSALTNKTLQTTLVSCSWGAVEEELPLDFIEIMDQVFIDAVLLGKTVCFSSGDKGDDPGPNWKPRVHFPATSPHVLSCGGTHWKTAPNRMSEVVWNETLLPKYVVKSGGGVSSIIKEPQWQSSADVKRKTRRSGRGIPDVSGKADIERGYCMQVAGFKITMGGTSAVAPMWTGLIARMNQALRCRIGYLTPLLYQNIFRKTFNDVTKGNNGKHFKADPGWDACTGWGTPNGKKLLAALKGK